MVKLCKRCGVEKPRSEFYSASNMADGLQGKCKECAKTASRANRARNIEAPPMTEDAHELVCGRLSKAGIPQFTYNLDPASIRWIRETYGPKRVSYTIQRAIDELKAREDVKES